MLTRPEGVVFDMDGLLLDSERLAREAFQEACLALGVTVEPEVYARCIGSNREATAAILEETLVSRALYVELDRRWDELYQRRIEDGEVALKPGATELLQALESYGIPRALATSTARPRATYKLERAGVISYFSCLICGGETDRGKPHPDPYLAAVTALGTRPHVTWALEDSENGVRAARAAGLAVIQVPDLVAPSDVLRELGHPVVTDLFAVCDELRRTCEGGPPNNRAEYVP